MKFTLLGHQFSIEKTRKEKPENGRRTGRTTRIIDRAVQTLFDKGVIYVRDHHPTHKASYDVFYRVLRRLLEEHNLTEKKMIVDRSNLMLKLKR